MALKKWIHDDPYYVVEYIQYLVISILKFYLTHWTVSKCKSRWFWMEISVNNNMRMIYIERDGISQTVSLTFGTRFSIALETRVTGTGEALISARTGGISITISCDQF